MPAPKMLSGLPKPVLFGLYGAVGGLLGALAFGELVWFLLRPPSPKPAEAPPPPEARLAITASNELQIYQNGQNKLIVRLARDEFDSDVVLKVEGLPAGVTAADVTVPKANFNVEGQAEAEIELRAALSAAAGAPAELKVVASAKPGGRPSTRTVTASSNSSRAICTNSVF